MGVERPGVVALLAPNAPDAIAVRYAANLLGAAACYLSAPPTAEARAALIRQIAPTLLVVFPDTLRLLPEGLAVPTVAVGDCGPSFARLDAAAAGQSGEPLECLARSEDLAVIVSSGGSTGVPKGSCRDFASYTRMAAAPSPPGPAPARQRASGLPVRGAGRHDAARRRLGGAARPVRRHGHAGPDRRPSGSPTCSWSSRSCSS